MDVLQHNRAAWDANVERDVEWTVPVSREAIQRARRGDWSILLTPEKPTPRDWFPADIEGVDTLCLASGGGQQGPVLAAAGAHVTVLDYSPRQLAQDRFVADREGLEIATVEGDMADLSMFQTSSFDLVVHPCSNCFAQQVRPVWRECFRVLRPGGALLAGFCNPVRYILEDSRRHNGVLNVRYVAPTSDVKDRSEEELRRQIVEPLEPLEFGHTLADQIGGQLDAGFALTGFFEDRFTGREDDPISKYLDTFIATRAIKLP